MFALIICGLLGSACHPKAKPAPSKTETVTNSDSTLSITAPPPPPFVPTEFHEINFTTHTARIPVFMYHDVIKKRGKGSVWFDCTVDEFEEQMNWLVAQGAHPITLAQLHQHLTTGSPVPDGAVVLTFDDNYQGFYDNAYPTLKRLQFPSAMFVHTHYVGDKTGDHPKMDWETLHKLEDEKLVTIGSHTVTHPDEMPKLTPQEQETELKESKATLETELKHPVPYLAYPNGKEDAVTRQIAQQVGYTMAFTVSNGAAEESPNVLEVHRFVHTRLEKGWDECQTLQKTIPAALVSLPLKDSPIRMELHEFSGIRLAVVRGGTPTTRHSSGRQSVGEFVKEAGGVAGINGTFFANAALVGTDNALIGPSLVPGGEFQPDLVAERLPRITNRPLVLWGPKRIAFFPFQPDQMNTVDGFRALMPDFTDLFLGGAWIVHEGIARTAEELKPYAASDSADARPRVFMGVMPDGEIVLGATRNVASTERMGEAAAQLGLQEAVLLDSGYSTSLVFGDKLLAVGHKTRKIPSRPVPHAIILTGAIGTLDPDAEAALTEARSATDIPKGDDEAPTHRRRRHRRKR